MTTIRNPNLGIATPNLGDATPVRNVQWRETSASGVPDLSKVDSYFNRSNAINGSAVDALRALPVDEQRRLLEAMTLDAKASRDPLAAQRVVDLYLALGKTGGPEALAQLGPRLASDIESLIDRADSASVANVAGANADTKAAIDRIRNGTFTPADLQYFTDDRNKGNLSQLTAEDKALVIQALISTGTGSTDSAKFQDARRVINVINSMRSVTEYNQVMSIVGGGDANKAHANIGNWVGDRATLKPANTSEDITVSLNAAFGGALAKPAAHSERRVTFAALTRDVGTQPPATGSGDTVTQGTPEQQAKKDWEAAYGRELQRGQGAFERARAQFSADGQMNLAEQFELLSFAADPSMLIDRFMAGDPDAVKLVSEERGMLMLKELMSRRGALRDGFSGMLDDENSRRKRAAQSIGQ
jgi:hypothetical protein